MKTILLVLLTAMITMACQAQHQNQEGTTRDNPTELPTLPTDSLSGDDSISTESPQLEEVLGANTAELLKEAQVIKAYLFETWASDTTDAGLLGFKVQQRLEAMPQAQQDSLMSILLQPGTYDQSDANKKCEFAPRLGFDLHSQEATYHVLVATNCDVLRIYAPDGLPLFTEDVDDAHTAFMALGAALFPAAIPQETNTSSDNQ